MGDVNLLLTMFGISLDHVDSLGTVVLLVLIILWFILGGAKELWVWGKDYRRLMKRLEETEQRLRIMEALALRGTDIADRLAPKEIDNDEDQ